MIKFSRRFFLGSLALAAAGCGRIIDDYTQPDLPKVLHPPVSTERLPLAHLLNRATYGPRPGQYAEAERLGATEWLARQLAYADIDDGRLNLRLERYDTRSLSAVDLLSFGGDEPYVTNELALITLQRALYSQRELYEVMVGFWSDHFSLYHFKEDVAFLKTVDDREVIRPHALGNFGEMLRASAHSPAMLVYLDNILNEKSHPNENYAREIMELHTLGVDGGYTETDIQEVARCFTGWSVDGRGRFTFIPEWHDEAAKTVLGQTIAAGGGKSDGDQVLALLIEHPSTARFICTKLLRCFWGDDPPSQVLSDCLTTWEANPGEIKPLLRTILLHSEFQSAPPKLKRPLELLLSLLRACNAEYNGSSDILGVLERLGQRPFAWPTPDGYPDTAAEWGGNLLGRWNLCLDMFKNRLPGVKVEVEAIEAAGKVHYGSVDWLPFWGRLLLLRDLTPADQQALTDYLSQAPSKEDVLGLLAASPAFQWR